MLVVGMEQIGNWMRVWNCQRRRKGAAWFQISVDSFDASSSHVHTHTYTHTHIYTQHKSMHIYIYIHKICIYVCVCVCVFHIYVFTYFILVKSHHGLHLLSMKLLFGNNWTPQIWISYLHFMNNTIVLISLTHPDSSPTRYSWLSEFACIRSVTLLQKGESFRFHFSTWNTQSSPNTTDCAVWDSPLVSDRYSQPHLN